MQTSFLKILKAFACSLSIVLLSAIVTSAQETETDQPSNIKELFINDRDWDNGDSLIITVPLTDSYYEKLQDLEQVEGHLLIGMSEEYGGAYRPVSQFPPNDGTWNFDEETKTLTGRVSGLTRHSHYFFRASWEPEVGELILLAESTEPMQTRRQWFIGEKWNLAFVGFVICGSVIFFIEIAKRGHPLKVRKIAGLNAVDEAVGRATEMGRSVLFVPGIQDLNDIQTIAGLNILSHVAKTAAEFDADVEVPTSRALVMTAARETLQGSYLSAGRPDAYNPDLAYYVTDEQFGYVAAVSGTMVREQPAACFYMGAFYAESLILAETGNSIGAIQVAGTAEPSQLPFFVAACDYTLIGEELFAASAYLSGAPEELGSLKGQDVGKIIVAIGIITGCIAATINVPFFSVLIFVLIACAIPLAIWWILSRENSQPTLHTPG
ncbi:DUF6754 domain-containing protein [Rubinisphaera italica]|uniref:DUF6754 domain-containing protein n=1 Tax=Rubinisphaera italica TaxID=2527969 RepID=A0A5C5XB80_9PLAN|nr:DUF6754 domain-containing protein [Rubinisphaera italica]TWT60407.1 hypothetical protein Pan54_11210 [Rubinisphaera italica]